MKKIIPFLLGILLLASGCRQISGIRERGSGNIKAETRNASGFTNIDVSGAIDVYIKQDSTTSVKVETDDNLLQYVEVETSGSTLEIYTERGVWLRPSNKIKVYVSTPSFKEFTVSGASSISSENLITSTEALHVGLSGASDGKFEFDAPKITVDLSGASEVSIRGKTKDFEAGGSGASHIRCYELLAENTNVDLSGASEAEVYASIRLKGEASGASSVDYKGSASANVEKSGASSVKKRD